MQLCGRTIKKILNNTVFLQNAICRKKKQLDNQQKSSNKPPNGFRADSQTPTEAKSSIALFIATLAHYFGRFLIDTHEKGRKVTKAPVVWYLFGTEWVAVRLSTTNANFKRFHKLHGKFCRTLHQLQFAKLWPWSNFHIKVQILAEAEQMATLNNQFL